jgi:hypothetical protein
LAAGYIRSILKDVHKYEDPQQKNRDHNEEIQNPVKNRHGTDLLTNSSAWLSMIDDLASFLRAIWASFDHWRSAI